MLAISLAVYLLVLSGDRPQLAQYAGIPLGLAYVIRPTNSIPVVVFGLYLLVTARAQFVRYVFWLLVIFIPFVLYNQAVFGTVLQSYFNPARLGVSHSVPGAMLGHLFSPSRGLFVFSPVLLASVIGIALAVKRLDLKSIEVYAALVILLHWIAVSLTAKWYGGWSIGPRFFTDMLPVLVFFLIPVVDRVPDLRHPWDAKALAFGALIALSVFVNFRASTTWAPFDWNHTPNNIDKYPGRLWDWSDVQFLRGLCAGQGPQAPGCWLESGLQEISGVLLVPAEAEAAGGSDMFLPVESLGTD
jgi:hypothetical protein